MSTSSSKRIHWIMFIKTVGGLLISMLFDLNFYSGQTLLEDEKRKFLQNSACNAGSGARSTKQFSNQTLSAKFSDPPKIF